MKRILKALFLGTMLAGSSSAFAQQVWSLDKCISHAKENNLQIRQNRLNVEQAKNNILQSKMDFLPSLSAGASHNMSWGRSVNLQTLEIIRNKRSMSSNASVSASLSIFQGLSKINTLKSNLTQLDINEQMVEQLQNEISIQITQAYLQVLLNQEIEKTAQESCKSVEEQVERTAKLVDAGSQAYSTLLEVKAQLASEKAQYIEAQNNVRTAMLNLIHLLDLPASQAEDFTISPPVEEGFQNGEYLYPSETVNSIFDKALDLPQIKQSELSLKKSEYDYRAVRGRYFPSLSLQAGYSSYYTDGQNGAFFSQFKDNKSPSIGFSLNIPIFNGLSTRTSVRNSRLAIENSRLNLEIQKQNLYKEIQTAYNNAFSALENMKAAEENMKSINESFIYTENKFNVGMMNATDYNIAKTNLFKAESSYYRAKYQYILQLKILDFYKGIPITL